jgi:phytoene desaturase
VDLRPVTPFYRIRFHDGESFEYTGDGAKMRDEIRRIAPGDLDGYERFVATSQEIFSVGFEKLAHVPFTRWIDMARVVPAMVKLESYRTVYGLVSKFVKDERLRQVLSFHPLLVGGNPFTTTSIYSLIPYLERKWGVHFPIGGTGALVRGLLDLVAGLGGSIRYGATVEEILVEGSNVRGVRLESGEVLHADVVVSNADSAWTYKHLLPTEHRHRWTDRKLENARYSMSLFVWYFGTRKTYPDVAHHTILLGPRYKELLTDIFPRARWVRRVLRTVACASPRRRDRLEHTGRALSEGDRSTPRVHGSPGALCESRHVAYDDAAAFSGRAPERAGRGVRPGARPAAKRVVPSAQQE